MFVCAVQLLITCAQFFKVYWLVYILIVLEMNRRFIFILLTLFIAQHTLTLHEARKEVYLFVISNNLSQQYKKFDKTAEELQAYHFLNGQSNEHTSQFNFLLCDVAYCRQLYTCMKQIFVLLVKPCILGLENIYIYIYTIIFVLPLTLLYLQGPLLAGFGFYQGRTLIDICSTITNVNSEFWTQNIGKCSDIIYVHLNSFLLSCHIVIVVGMVVLVLGLYIFDWLCNRMSMTFLHNSKLIK